MFNTSTFVGYIISADEPRFSTEQTCIEVKFSSKTGEKKKEGEQYDPAHIISFLLWGKYAEAMRSMLTPRTLIAVTGQLATPNMYQKNDGTIGYTLKFVDNRVDTLKILSRPATEGEEQRQSAPAASSSSRRAPAAPSAATAEVFGDFDDDDFEDDEF